VARRVKVGARDMAGVDRGGVARELGEPAGRWLEGRSERAGSHAGVRDELGIALAGEDAAGTEKVNRDRSGGR
jgi:hypothetical protein